MPVQGVLWGYLEKKIEVCIEFLFILNSDFLRAYEHKSRFLRQHCVGGTYT